jgi:hypothetical protein
MSNNIRADLADFPSVVDPNYKGITSVNQKIYPVTSIISSTNTISGNAEWIYSVPQGFRQDVSKTYLVVEASFNKAAPPSVTAGPAPNVIATLWQTGRLEINNFLVSQSSNIPAEDTMFKILVNSGVKNETVNSLGLWAGTDAARFAQNNIDIRKQYLWRPDMLMSAEQVYPENTRIHLTLSVAPNVNTAASCPCAVDITGAAADIAPKIYSMYLMVNFVKIDNPTPSQVFIPAYNVKSSYTNVSGVTDNNLQFTILPQTYKVVVGLQSSAATVAAGQAVTKFSSGSSGAAQNAYSKFLRNLQLRYAGTTYPNAPYAMDTTTAGSNVCGEPYADFLGACDASFDPSGAITYATWSDPISTTSVGQGRLFAWNIVKPSNDMDANCELTIQFSTAPTTTKVVVFSIAKTAIGIQYGPNKQVQEIKNIPYS